MSRSSGCAHAKPRRSCSRSTAFCSATAQRAPVCADASLASTHKADCFVPAGTFREPAAQVPAASAPANANVKDFTDEVEVDSACQAGLRSDHFLTCHHQARRSRTGASGWHTTSTPPTRPKPSRWSFVVEARCSAEVSLATQTLQSISRCAWPQDARHTAVSVLSWVYRCFTATRQTQP